MVDVLFGPCPYFCQDEEWAKHRNKRSGVLVSFPHIVCVCTFGGGSLGGGVTRLLGTKVPQSDSPETRGGPWAPPPRLVVLKAVLFSCWSFVGFRKMWISLKGLLLWESIVSSVALQALALYVFSLCLLFP